MAHTMLCPECNSEMELGPSLRGTFSDGTIIQSADLSVYSCTNPDCGYILDYSELENE